jgi:hypothetical protein
LGKKETKLEFLFEFISNELDIEPPGLTLNPPVPVISGSLLSVWFSLCSASFDFSVLLCWEVSQADDRAWNRALSICACSPQFERRL